MIFSRTVTLLFCVLVLQGCAAGTVPDTRAMQEQPPESAIQTSAGPDAALATTRGDATQLQLHPPASGQLTSPFGMRKLNKKKKSVRFHSGIDLSAPRGTRVDAAASGVVIFSGRKKDYGLMVEIRHAKGMVTRYAHLDSLKTKKGVRVTAGTAIGTMGRTGRTTGVNLHFEVIVDGNNVNPIAALGREFSLQSASKG